MTSLLVVIPAFNEAHTIAHVIKSIPTHLPRVKKVDILVIDDGSTDTTYKTTRTTRATVLQHRLNRGLGAALATGFVYALSQNYDFVVTFDADGQHRVDDLRQVVQALINHKGDVVVGSRLFGKGHMPVLRKIVNFFSNVFTFLLFNIWTTDSQSGLRGFTKEALQKIRIRSQRMEVSSEIFKEISRLKLRLVEVPISSIYTHYSLSKGQPITNAPQVAWKLFLHRFV